MTISNDIAEQVDQLIWPFYRYTVLLPKQIKGDLFVWLYLSLVVYRNQKNNLSKLSYTEGTKEEVKRILNDKFNSVLDGLILEKVIANAEKDFVVTNENQIRELKDTTLSFLDTYETLYSENCEMQYVFQDALTGEVLPFFGDLSAIEARDSKDIKNSFRISSKVKEPTKSAIQKAYKRYYALEKYNNDTAATKEVEEVDVEVIEDNDPFTSFKDEDKQEFFSNQLDDLEEPTNENIVHKKKKKLDFNEFKVVYTQDTKVTYYLMIDVIHEGNSLYLKSPFSENTDSWMNECLLKARNIFSDVNDKMKSLEDDYIIPETEDYSSTFSFSDMHDAADQLKFCGPLFRLVSKLGNKDLMILVSKINNYYEMNNESYFSKIGEFLECLIEPFKNTDNLQRRRNYDLSMYCREIEAKFHMKNIDYSKLTYQDVFENWIKGWTHFKADIVDILLKTDLVNSSMIYRDFINDVFELYSIRNDGSHYKKNKKLVMNQDQLDKLFKVSQVLAQLY